MQAPVESLSAAGGLPTGDCKACGRRVLVHEGPGGVPCCVHCDSTVRAPALVGDEELETLGYAAIEEPKGCGTGCGTGCAVRPQT